MSDEGLALIRVGHSASDRNGWAVQHQRRFSVDGAWVVWDEHSRRPTWHPWTALHPLGLQVEPTS